VCIKRLVRSGLGMFLVAFLVMLSLVFIPANASAAGTTSLTITKLDSDGLTVLAEETVTYEWLEENLPVMGDGNIHYYHQGPVFVDNSDPETQEMLRWNPKEDTNIETKDMGAVMGTNVKDLCELVGGMEEGDEIQIKAIDGFKKTFAYKNVYEYSDREGPMVICWYKDGEYPDGGYRDGMRLVWFADTLVNPWGYHVFGNWDWHEAADPEYWYYYQGEYPTTTGLSVQNVSQLIIYNETAPVTPKAAFTADATSGNVPLEVKFTDQSTAATSWAWDFDNNGVVDSTEQNPIYEYTEPGTYSVKLTVTNSAGSDEEIKTDYITVSEPSTVDILFDGTVALPADETFTITAYNSDNTYTINKNTPLGALHAAAIAGGFNYDVTDKKYSPSSEVLLLDNIGNYNYVKGGSEWYAYVNGVYKDGYTNSADALNLVELIDGDKVEFYYADSETTDYNVVKEAAIAGVKIIVDSDATTPSTWNLLLKGAKDETVSKDYFEQGLACPNSGHYVTWTDGDNNVWGGIPLWLLVAMVDDDPDVGPDHFNFNDELAAQNYVVKVWAGDGWSATFQSADIARNDGYIVANTLNEEPLPMKTESDKDCWPLHLKGGEVAGGEQVGNIVKIELTNLPEPPAGWTLEMLGEVGDTITQAEFEEGLACTGSGHYQEWTDKDGNIWSGVPLWVLLGTVDDIEDDNHWTFNDSVAAEGYTVKVVAGDEEGYYKEFDIADVERSNGYIVANKCNNKPLDDDSAPLRLVGPGVTKDDGSLGGSAVGNIVRIEIPELQTPAAGEDSWNLKLVGKISDVISQAEFEEALACPRSGHQVEWTDGDGNKWSGIPLWFLIGWVDDREPHAYDVNQANAGYTVLVKAQDYTKDFSSKDLVKSSNYIIANKCNGAPLTDSWPLRLVGAGVAKDDGTLGGTSVGNVVEIELTAFGMIQPIPELRIVKYGEDRTTIINEMTVDYHWMEENLEVIGDGETVYRYEGITNNPDDVWDADETYPGGFKIENAVKGTRVKDLCELVGGMGVGTDIVFVASDGWETKLPYSSIYTDPAVQARQGDAIIAWWGDGNYVPDYRDGMRLFFMPEDKIFGQWDMHEAIPEQYWHYYYGDGVMYPSCAGLSAKYITEIKIYSVPEQDWTLELDGKEIGGIDYQVSKTYFESALTCQMGANHKATYTDNKNRVWEGMPLWFLAGFVDDQDQHSDNAFNNELAESGYQVVITAKDGSSVTIDSADIIRNSDYIIANTLNGALLDESGDYWPLRLVGPAVTGKASISQIVSIKLVPVTADQGKYNIVPEADAAYTIGETQDGIKTMTVKSGVTGFKYFTVNITPVTAHSGNETVVFAHFRNGSQLALNATRADFDVVGTAQAGFNTKSGDVIKAYIVDNLTNAIDFNPTILQ
jgi:PKD repeat protein/DMSO/TMAO reductase YedYZ molybdopterin-dependent catalytic subunit